MIKKQTKKTHKRSIKGPTLIVLHELAKHRTTVAYLNTIQIVQRIIWFNMLVGHSNRQGVWGSPPHLPIIFWEFNRFDFLYSGAFWGWPLPIYLLFIQIHSLHPDLQSLDKLTVHIQTYFMAIPPAIAIWPIVVILKLRQIMITVL